MTPPETQNASARGAPRPAPICIRRRRSRERLATEEPGDETSLEEIREDPERSSRSPSNRKDMSQTSLQKRRTTFDRGRPAARRPCEIPISRAPVCLLARLTARGESLASHRDGRGAPPARRDDREYREYLSEEQRSWWGCIARRMQPDFHHGLPARRSAMTPRHASWSST